jgi:hypothetical protein
MGAFNEGDDPLPPIPRWVQIGRVWGCHVARHRNILNTRVQGNFLFLALVIAGGVEGEVSQEFSCDLKNGVMPPGYRWGRWKEESVQSP